MIKEIIENKFINVKKNNDKYINIMAIAFPEIGCNANCSYCFQKGTRVKQNIDIVKEIKEITKYLPKSVKEINIMGGELKILSLENQLKLINLINELKKDYKISLLVNDTKMDSPLMKINDVCYIVHILNWKNRNLLDLDKKLNKTNSKFIYKIVITDKDTEEEVSKFLEINKEIREKLSFNIDRFSSLSFKKIENSKTNVIDEKQEIFFCAKKREYLSSSITKCNDKYFINYCCGDNEYKEFFSLKELLFYLRKIKNGKVTIDYKKCKNCKSFRNF